MTIDKVTQKAIDAIFEIRAKSDEALAATPAPDSTEGEGR